MRRIQFRSSAAFVTTLSALVASLVPSVGVFAQGAESPITVQAKPVAINDTIRSVTLYQGRAAVTRQATIPLAAPAATGVFELRFDELPPSTIADSLQATIAAPGKLLDVRYEERLTATDVASDPDAVRLRGEIEGLKRTIAGSHAKREALASSTKLLDSIALRIADQVGKGFGGEAIDATKLSAQVKAIASEREAIAKEAIAIDEEVESLNKRLAAAQAALDALGSASRMSRVGIVTVAIASEPAAPLDVRLTYLVTGATWYPSYSIRAAGDLSGLQVEYDAVIRQQSGEAWNDVALVLSTAQPARAAAPSEIEPIYVDLLPEASARYGYSVDAPATTKSAAPPPAESAMPYQAGRDADAEAASREAEVVQNATAATFSLPRTVSIVSDAQQDQRTRIATIDLKPTYTYVTPPLTDPAAYLRGTVRNDSKYQFLAGKARIFLGGDSVGVTSMEDIAPGAEFDLWFGIDKRIEVKRTLVARNTSVSGLLSKSDDIEWQWSIELTNNIPAATSIEVWDRMPVARHEDVTVTLSSVNPALATDKKYEANERRQGLLKWSLTMPAAVEGQVPISTTIKWTVKLSKPEKSQITPLPE